MKDKCAHPEAVRVDDPFDEERSLCGACGDVLASNALKLRTLQQMLEAQQQMVTDQREVRERWREAWRRKHQRPE